MKTDDEAVDAHFDASAADWMPVEGMRDKGWGMNKKSHHRVCWVIPFSSLIPYPSSLKSMAFQIRGNVPHV